MRPESVESIKTCLSHCARIGAAEGAEEAIAVVRRVGGEFIRLGDQQPNPDPLRWLDAEGHLMIGAYFRHPALQLDRATRDIIRLEGLPPDTKPWARFSFIQTSRSVNVSQDALLEDQRLVDRIALGQLSLACDLYPHLLPRYGWIDEVGLTLPQAQGIAANQLEYVFWANFFGPDYVRLLGKEFLAHAPGWRLVDCPDGGVLYVATESYLDWWYTDHEEILDYFRRKVPDVELFRSKDRTWMVLPSLGRLASGSEVLWYLAEEHLAEDLVHSDPSELSPSLDLRGIAEEELRRLWGLLRGDPAGEGSPAVADKLLFDGSGEKSSVFRAAPEFIRALAALGDQDLPGVARGWQRCQSFVGSGWGEAAVAAMLRSLRKFARHAQHRGKPVLQLYF